MARTSHLIINYGLRAFLAAKLLPLVPVVLDSSSVK